VEIQARIQAAGEKEATHLEQVEEGSCNPEKAKFTGRQIQLCCSGNSHHPENSGTPTHPAVCVRVEGVVYMAPVPSNVGSEQEVEVE